MSTPCRFDDKDYINWLKCSLALIHFKEGLHDYIDTEVNNLHADIHHTISTISVGTSVQNQCYSCTWRDIKQEKGSWTIKCQNKICDIWLSEILANHTNPQNQNINWKNADITRWPTDAYEVAKVYMPKGQDQTKNLPQDFDAPAILSLLKYCVWFSQKIPNTNILSDLIEIRNEVMYSSDLRITDFKKDICIDKMVQLLSHLNIHGTVLIELQKAKREEIKFNFRETEVRVLSSVVSSIKGSMDYLCDDQHQFSGDLDTVQTTLSSIQVAQTHQRQDIQEETDSQGIKSEVEQLTEIYQKIKSFLANNPDIDDKNILENLQAIEGREMKGIKRKCAEIEDKGEEKHQTGLEGTATLRSFTLEDIMKAWESIETKLLDELDPIDILSFITFLSESECQAVCHKEKRREMVERFLLRVKENLPCAFFVLLDALEKTGKGNVVRSLNNIIQGTCDLEAIAHVSNQSTIKVKVSVMTKNGSSSHNAETKIKDDFRKGSSVFSSDLCSLVVDVERGSVIICLRPLSKHAQETLAFFCQHGGMKDYILNLLKKKDLFASLPMGEVHIEVEVSCHEEDIVSEDTHTPQEDFISRNFEVSDNPKVIKENLLLQYGTLLEEIEPLNLQETFVGRGILDKSFFKELTNLRRRERAAHFLQKVLHTSNEALVALVEALKDSGRENLATKLCCVQKKTQHGDTDQVDDTLVQVVGEVSQMHANETLLWSCRLDLLIGSRADEELPSLESSLEVIESTSDTDIVKQDITTVKTDGKTMKRDRNVSGDLEVEGEPPHLKSCIEVIESKSDTDVAAEGITSQKPVVKKLKKEGDVFGDLGEEGELM